MSVTGKHWKPYKLGDLIEKVVDNRGSTPPYNNRGGMRLIESWQVKNTSIYPRIDASRQKYVSLECYENWFRDCHPRSQDILITTVGVSIPQVCLVPAGERLCIAQNIVGVRARASLVEQEFLYLYFLSGAFMTEVKRHIVTTVQPSLRVPSLLEVDCRLPPLSEQRAIVEYIIPFIKKLEVLERQNETLEKLSEHLFLPWYDELLVSRSLVPVTAYYKFIPGARLSSKHYHYELGPGRIRYIRVGDLHNYHSKVCIDKGLSNKLVGREDVLISLDGTIGKLNFGVEGVYSSGLRKVVALDAGYNYMWFKYLLLGHKSIMERIKNYAVGSVVQHAGSAVGDLTMAQLSESDLIELDASLSPFFARLLHNRAQVKFLYDTLEQLTEKFLSAAAPIESTTYVAAEADEE